MKATYDVNAIKEEVVRRGWKFEQPFTDKSFYKVTNDKGEWLIGRGSRLGYGSANGMIIARDKLSSYQFVESLGIKVAPYKKLKTLNEAEDFLKKHGTIVMKPLDAEQGRGVTINIRDARILRRAYKKAHYYSTQGVIGQAQMEGKLYRILVIGNKVVAAAERQASSVTGDGRRTVKELIQLKNQSIKNGGAMRGIKRLSAEIARSYLGGKVLESILPRGKVLVVDSLPSRSGESRNVTKAINKQLERILVKITRSLDLSVCGFDIITEDITKLTGIDFLPLVELNSKPGLKSHLFSTLDGDSINPAPFILDYAFSFKNRGK